MISPRSSWQPSSKSENSVCRTFQYFPNVSARDVYYTQILQRGLKRQCPCMFTTHRYYRRLVRNSVGSTFQYGIRVFIFYLLHTVTVEREDFWEKPHLPILQQPRIYFGRSPPCVCLCVYVCVRSKPPLPTAPRPLLSSPTSPRLLFSTPCSITLPPLQLLTTSFAQVKPCMVDIF